MIKNIKLIITGTFLLVFGTQCSKSFLELENENNLVESSFYKTESDFNDLLLTCYMPLGFADVFGSTMHVVNWAMDDRVIHEQFNTSQLQYDASKPDFATIYKGLYTGVFRTNLFLQKFTADIAIDDSKRKEMIAQAHFLRGIYYFYLGMLFEVSPLLTEPSTDPRTGLPNSTQDAIYELVKSDFLAAIDGLPVEWDNTNTGRATKGAAMAFLGKLYLYQGKFDEAAIQLKAVIDSKTYELSMPKGTDSLDYVFAYLANFSDVDLPNGNKIYKAEFNSESIYEISFSSIYDEGARASQYLPMRRSTGSHITWFNGYSNITGGYGNVAIDDKVFPNEFEKTPAHPAGLLRDARYYGVFIRPGDTLDFRPEVVTKYMADRGNVTFQKSDINSTLGTTFGIRKGLYPFHTKYTYANAPFNDPKNWRLMRYADVLLMYAEAAYRATAANPSEGLNALNEVRSRAGVPLLASLSKAAIIHERDIELAGEHSRYWDLVRWYKDGWLTLTDVQARKPTFQPKNVCWPIPLNEINKNYGVMKQNPKWN